MQDKTAKIFSFIDFELFSSVKWTKESPTKRSSWSSQAQAFAGRTAHLPRREPLGTASAERRAVAAHLLRVARQVAEEVTSRFFTSCYTTKRVPFWHSLLLF
mgnify:CR=1 FL=1